MITPWFSLFLVLGVVLLNGFWDPICDQIRHWDEEAFETGLSPTCMDHICKCRDTMSCAVDCCCNPDLDWATANDASHTEDPLVIVSNGVCTPWQWSNWGTIHLPPGVMPEFGMQRSLWELDVDSETSIHLICWTDRFLPDKIPIFKAS